MLLAAIGDTPYRIVLLLHILTAMAAFAPAFAHPLLTGQAKSLDSSNQQKVMSFLVANGRRIYAPALILTGFLGFALQGMSDGVWEFGQTWFILALIIWIAMNGVLHALIIPNERRMANGESEAESMVAAGGMAISLLLVIMLYLMIFKPGL